MSERPVDIWNEMTTQARVTGRCMLCEEPLYSATKRPIICTDDGCRRARDRLYQHLVRRPFEKSLPKDQQEKLRLRRNERERIRYGIRRRRDGDAGVRQLLGRDARGDSPGRKVKRSRRTVPH